MKPPLLVFEISRLFFVCSVPICNRNITMNTVRFRLILTINREFHFCPRNSDKRCLPQFLIARRNFLQENFRWKYGIQLSERLAFLEALWGSKLRTRSSKPLEHHGNILPRGLKGGSKSRNLNEKINQFGSRARPEFKRDEEFPRRCLNFVFEERRVNFAHFCEYFGAGSNNGPILHNLESILTQIVK